MKLILKFMIAAAVTAFSMNVNAHDRPHIIHKKKCAEWKIKISKNYSKQWAFAQNPEGTHCGINYNNKYVKDAEFKAVKICNKKSKNNDCKLARSSR